MYESQKINWIKCEQTDCDAYGKEGQNAWKQCIKKQLAGTCQNKFLKQHVMKVQVK